MTTNEISTMSLEPPHDVRKNWCISKINLEKKHLHASQAALKFTIFKSIKYI